MQYVLFIRLVDGACRWCAFGDGLATPRRPAGAPRVEEEGTRTLAADHGGPPPALLSPGASGLPGLASSHPHLPATRGSSPQAQGGQANRRRLQAVSWSRLPHSLTVICDKGLGEGRREVCRPEALPWARVSAGVLCAGRNARCWRRRPD